MEVSAFIRSLVEAMDADFDIRYSRSRAQPSQRRLIYMPFASS